MLDSYSFLLFSFTAMIRKTSMFNEVVEVLILFVGCETNWFEFRGHCYTQVQGQYTWDEAKVIKNYH